MTDSLYRLQEGRDSDGRAYRQCSQEFNQIFNEMGIDDGSGDVRYRKEDAFFSYYRTVLEKGLNREERKEALHECLWDAFY